jgi:hypothetical protein
MRARFLTFVAATTLAAAAFVTWSVAENASAQSGGAAAGSITTEGRGSPGALAVPSVTVLGSQQAQGVLGKQVRSSADEDMGRIVDVIVDPTGRVRAAVIDFGGFLGVGSRRIAIDWDALRFPPAGSKTDVVVLELTRDQVKAAPEYKDKQPVVVVGAAGGFRALPVD